MPYPNEHAARIKSPSNYDNFRRKNNELGSGIDVIYGIKNDETEIQSIRFDKKKFTTQSAKKWLRDNGYSFMKFEPASEISKSHYYDDKKKKPKKRPKKTYYKKENTNFPSYGDNKKITISNSKFPQFSYAYAKNLKEKYPELWRRAGTGGNPPTSFTGDDAFRMWGRYKDGSRTRGVLSWIKRREKFATRHYKNVGLNGAIAHMKWGTINASGVSGMKRVINEAKKKIDDRRRKRRMRKSNDSIELTALIKNVSEDQRIVSGPVLVPDTIDLQNDMISAEEIQKAAHGFMKDFQQINILHSSNYDDFAEDIVPVESVVLKNDIDFYGNGEILKKGTWILDVYVGNDEVWSLIKEGKIRAYSIEGEGERVLV